VKLGEGDSLHMEDLPLQLMVLGVPQAVCALWQLMFLGVLWQLMFLGVPQVFCPLWWLMFLSVPQVFCPLW
jgi:hypothetical protein